MAFTAQDVKTLREKTGCGMMDCKKALTESNGDMDAAIDFLREKGLAAATKKAGRIAAEGVAYAFVTEDNSKAVAIEVNAETDFVAKNDDFVSFVKVCAQTVADNSPADMDALLACKAAGSELTVDELLKEKILTIGENIKIRRFTKYDGVVTAYVHAAGRIAVIANFETDANTAASETFKEYAKNVAMQVAASNPLYLEPASVPAEVLEHEKSILVSQMKEDPKMAGKPDAVLGKIVDGKMGKYFSEVCLTEQAYVKDPDLSVAKYTAAVAKELGATIAIKGFVRFEKGEGLEKRSDNFADEVASMIK